MTGANFSDLRKANILDDSKSLIMYCSMESRSPLRLGANARMQVHGSTLYAQKKPVSDPRARFRRLMHSRRYAVIRANPDPESFREFICTSSFESSLRSIPRIGAQGWPGIHRSPIFQRPAMSNALAITPKNQMLAAFDLDSASLQRRKRRFTRCFQELSRTESRRCFKYGPSVWENSVFFKP